MKLCCSCIRFRSAVIAISVVTMLQAMADIFIGAVAYNSSTCDFQYQNCHQFTNWFVPTTIVQGVVTLLVSCGLLAGVLTDVQHLLALYVFTMTFNVLTYLGIGVVLRFFTDHPLSDVFGYWFLVWAGLLVYFISVTRLYWKEVSGEKRLHQVVV